MRAWRVFATTLAIGALIFGAFFVYGVVTAVTTPIGG